MQLKSEISTLEQERKNTLQKENETHEKFILANSKFENEKKISEDLKSEVDRLLHQIQFSDKKREEILENNNALKVQMEKKERIFKEKGKELGEFWTGHDNNILNITPVMPKYEFLSEFCGYERP